MLLFWIILHKMLNTHHIKFKRKFYMSLVEMFNLQFIVRLVMKFCLIVDEALDKSRREQITIIIRFVDINEFIREYFFRYNAC